MSDHLGPERGYLGKDELKRQSSLWFLGQTSGQVRRRSHLPDNNLKSPGTCFPAQHDLWDPRSHFKEHKSQGNRLISWKQMTGKSFFFIIQRIGDWNKRDLLAWNQSNEKLDNVSYFASGRGTLWDSKHLLNYLDLRWADNLRCDLTSHKVYNISIPGLSHQPCGKMQADCAAARGRTTWRTKCNDWKRLPVKLHSSVDFSDSSSNVHQVCNTAPLSLWLLHGLWSLPFSCRCVLCTSLLISAFTALACTSTLPSALD